MTDWDPFSNPTPAHLVNRAARAFTRLGESRLKPFGIGVGHLPVLAALRSGAALSQKELAQFARIEQPSMAQMLARMERDGLIRRVPDPQDGRSSLISLTETALARLPAVREVLMSGNAEALAGFSDEEIATLAALLQRLNRNLDRTGADQPPAGPDHPAAEAEAGVTPPGGPAPRRSRSG
ncbi:DNA-binding MarR family transcriptional regulator [Labrys wisconsinensis]|uniref:DNA-binding MarR family transcriptional regulator n=1 Tax=Labrys wisconsinensis TaxID=425677 RepID=A0ABU0JL15_9HYPH|nr:MarR family transcriptional regulator [Labrys wisconsinensis]MDQ0474300.1 DNA-binding MarR family transcriptional regulator [Labrys wisconsinensis]